MINYNSNRNLNKSIHINENVFVNKNVNEIKEINLTFINSVINITDANKHRKNKDLLWGMYMDYIKLKMKDMLILDKNENISMNILLLNTTIK